MQNDLFSWSWVTKTRVTLTAAAPTATEQPSWSFRLLLLVFGRRGSNLLLSLWETSSSLYFVKFMLKNLLSHPQIEPVTCSLSSGYTYCTRMHTYAHSRSTYFDLHIFQNFIYHLSCAPPPHTPHTHTPTHSHVPRQRDISKALGASKRAAEAGKGRGNLSRGLWWPAVKRRHTGTTAKGRGASPTPIKSQQKQTWQILRSKYFPNEQKKNVPPNYIKGHFLKHGPNDDDPTMF